MNLPSFSIVYETENLSSVDLKNIYHSLASLNMQEVSLESANEFLLINSGNLPDNIIQDWTFLEEFKKILNLHLQLVNPDRKSRKKYRVQF